MAKQRAHARQHRHTSGYRPSPLIVAPTLATLLPELQQVCGSEIPRIVERLMARGENPDAAPLVLAAVFRKIARDIEEGIVL